MRGFLYCFSTAHFHMVVKDRQCMLKHTLSCSTARFRMVVKASGTGVYMQMNEYGTDLDGYEVQNIKIHSQIRTKI